ncbi:MAG: energy transducer TonB [Pseudomonadota bacterium]
MKKTIAALCALVIGITAGSAIGDDHDGMVYQAVVDRSTRDKGLNDYVMLTKEAIQRAWKTPLDLQDSSAVKGKIRINYTIARDGALDSIHLIKSSGNSEMDRSLIQAIRDAEPFPAFPDDIRAAQVMVRANFIVADLPSAPVTVVSQPAAPWNEQNPAQVQKKERPLTWGRQAAGSGGEAKTGEQEAEPVTAAPPVERKYQWGR